MKKFLMVCFFFFFAIVSLQAGDHKILVCENSLETLEWVVKLIESGEQTIEMAAPYLGGQVGCRILHAMARRMEEKPKLQIYLLLYPIFLEEEEKRCINDLKERFPERFHLMETLEVSISYPQITTVNNHMKLLVVDEKYFVVGGTNLDDYLCTEGTYTKDRSKEKDPLVEHPSGARDSDVIGSGSLAQELRITYHKLFALWENFQVTKQFVINPEHFAEKSHYTSLSSSDRVAWVDEFEESERAFSVQNISMVFSGPMHRNNRISQEYARLIQGAKKSITIGNLYFNPSKEIMDALMRAVQRRCSLTYIGNGLYPGFSPKYNVHFAWANRLNYVPLFYGRTFYLWQANLASFQSVGKVRIYEYYVRDILYHKKTMVIDDHILVIGSYNLGMKSVLGDYELILVIDSPEVAKAQMKVFQRDLQFSKEISPDSARQWYFDPWVSYLGGLQKQFHGLI